MGAPPKFTAVWPETAFDDAAWRKRQGSCDSSEGSSGKGSGRRGSLLRPSKARHPNDAARIGNAVVQSYLSADTYRDYRGLTYTALLVIGLLAAPLGLLAGYVFRRLTCNYIANFFAPHPGFDCLTGSNDNCTELTVTYLWNITNPAQVLAGEPPQLSEVGPFTMRRTTANYNIRFDHARRRADWQWLHYDELVPDKSCAACTSDALIYGPNSIYAGIMQSVGWSEVPLLLQFVPGTVSTLIDNVGAVLSIMAAQPALVRLFPGLAAPAAERALVQWAQCGALGGMAVRALGNTDINNGLPWPPEFCGWATAVMGASADEARLPLPSARLFLDTLASNPNFAEQMTHYPPDVLATVLELSEAQARLLLGYVQFIAFTYSKAAYAKMLGPPLGRNSSGPIVGRSFDEWHFGFNEPLLSALKPRDPAAPWWAYNNLAAPRGRRLSDAPRWAALAAAVGAGAAPEGAAQRFFSTAIATGRPGPYLAEAGDVLEDSGAAWVRHPGGVTGVRGRVTRTLAAGFGDMSRMPFGLKDTPTVYWYWGRYDLAVDPGAKLGLGRALPLSLKGGYSPYMHHYVAALDYHMHPDAFTPCGADLRNASAAAVEASRLACVYGDDLAGVWNLSAVGTPMFFTRAHFYGADPALAASLGPDAATVLQPNEEEHDWTFALDTMIGVPLTMRLTMQMVIGLRPSPVFFPKMWNGAPGPGGFTFYPATWSKVRYQPDDLTAMRMRQSQHITDYQPRETAGNVTIAGSIVAGFAAFSLWHMRLEEKAAVRAEVRKRLDSVASSSAEREDGDEEAYYPHERRGSGVK